MSYEDYEAMARHKLERQCSAASSRSLKRYPPGMTYEEITSSRKSSVTKIPEPAKKNEENEAENEESLTESLEPLQEKDIKATGSDPYEKFNYKMGTTLT